MSLYIDVHCHLDHPRFNDLDKVIENARKAGLKIVLTNGLNPETNRKTLEIAKEYNIVRAALGIYPVNQLTREIKEGNYPLKLEEFDVDEEIKFIRKSKDKIIAIGECGLDGLDKENIAEQKTVFEKLINLAEKIKKPIIVHSRKAESDVIDMLESSRIKKAILHCFSGRKHLVKKAADLGYYFSIPANVVRAQNFQLMAEIVNINQLFCETDAPYLSPFQGKRNEPMFVVEAYKKIAEIKGFDVKEVENNLWVNFNDLF